jgi:hypothetical protein
MLQWQFLLRIALCFSANSVGIWHSEQLYLLQLTEAIWYSEPLYILQLRVLRFRTADRFIYGSLEW